MEQLVARRAHNPKVVGSSPAPATLVKSKVFSRKSKDFFRLEHSENIVSPTIKSFNMTDAEILEQIDRAHVAANEALENKQLATYIGFFTDNLQYKQRNGKIIGKAQLTKDIKLYFKRIRSFSGCYERKIFTIDEDKIVERLIQQSTVAIRVFIVFSKNWTVEREGIYKWVKVNGSWKIWNVEILNEKIS